MIKRTIEISRHPAHLSVKHDQLKVQRHTDDESGPLEASIPCEDIGVMVVDHHQTTYTHQALARLVEHGAAVVICGRNHQPTGLLLPISSNTETVTRLHEQIGATQPLVKQLWKQIVVAKVRAQATALPDHLPEKIRLKKMQSEVRSGDPTNVEAQAAKTYWAGWRKVDSRLIAFRRDPDGDDPANGMLNYGYTVLRASMGRAIIAAGLHPALGVHHTHRANAFALADDLIEPLRPIIDGAVFQMLMNDQTDLTQDNKAVLLGKLTSPVRTDGQVGPLMVSLHRYVASLVWCYRREQKKLVFPVYVGDNPDGD